MNVAGNGCIAPYAAIEQPHCVDDVDTGVFSEGEELVDVFGSWNLELGAIRRSSSHAKVFDADRAE